MIDPLSLLHTHIETPIGPLLVVRKDHAIIGVNFMRDGAPAPAPAGSRRDDSGFLDVIAQFRAYFAGELRAFDLLTSPSGTEFQMNVWRALERIPYGTTTTYGTLSEKIGRREASRAVGAANGANPIPVIIPCHRVIGSKGKLTGFGGGLEVKRFLLDLEAGARRLSP